mmetsp:Transcript_99381/g.186673  ORF Transcript_99381/g.186673 Transcript_99381/m.186673 type:complete len:87 (+) Transcript_99381:95-355(+)
MLACSSQVLLQKMLAQLLFSWEEDSTRGAKCMNSLISEVLSINQKAGNPTLPPSENSLKSTLACPKQAVSLMGGKDADSVTRLLSP